MYKPKHLEKWRRCGNYIGEDYSDYYCITGHSRDSDMLEESNFQSIKRYLQSKNVAFEEISASHWAVGWVESILIHESDETGLLIGDDIAKQLEDYPIFDEDDFGIRELENAYEILDDIKSMYDGDISKYYDEQFDADLTDDDKIGIILERMN